MYIPFEIEKYEVKGLLGRGAEAKVYLLWDKESNRMVAAKVGRDASGLYRQGEVMRSIPGGVCPEVYGFEEKDGQGILYMEYVEGETLQEYRRCKGPLSEEEAVQLLIKIIDLLIYVHQKGVAYLDNKPSNIILRKDGRVCLIDFGAASRLGCNAGVRGGTYGYAAPEQFWRGVETDERSDVYACGKLLLYLMTQKDPAYPPYEDEVFLPALPVYMQDIVRTATACDVRYRYRDLLNLKQKLYENFHARRRRLFHGKSKNCIICEKSIWKSDYFRE